MLNQIFKNWADCTSAERNELVFANKNKAYGAYEIRRKYDITLLIALSTGVALFVAVILSPLLMKADVEHRRKEFVVTNDPIDLSNLKKDKEEPYVAPTTPKVLEHAQSPSISTTRLTDMDMVDDRVNEHINTQDAAVDAHIGTQDHHSDVDDNDVVIPEDTHNNSNGTLTDGGDDDAPHINVEEMPEFPGGEQALMQYVAKHIIYPQDAKEIDIDGKVIVRFVVERNGSVDEVQIARGVYRSLDSEAKRVIQSMPVWKPGKQNGRPVRVLFTMPIVFHIGR